MRLNTLATLLIALGGALAADEYGEYEEEEYGSGGANNATTPTAQDGDVTIHYVTVGKEKNEFQPNSIVAKEGDIVSFQFFPLNHSVIQAKYGYPCVPIEAVDYEEPGFYSGFFPVDAPKDNPPTWNITVNSTEPIFYYCGNPGSCFDWGMVGVINANASLSLSTQMALAMETDYMLLPGENFPSEKVEGSLSKLAHAATTANNYASATSAAGNSDETPSGSSGLSGGTVAGIAVGTAAIAIILVALWLLMRRTRSLKRKLELKVVTPKGSPGYIQPASPAATYSRGYGGSTIYNNQPPPYRPYYHLERPDANEQLHVANGFPEVACNPGTSPGSFYSWRNDPSPISPSIPTQAGIGLSADTAMRPTVFEMDTKYPETSGRQV